MKNPSNTLIACLFSMLASGCMASVGTSGTISVPPDARATCETHCQKIGMGLGAVAIMANNVGCICDMGGKTSQGTSSAVSAGMATVVVQEQMRQQQAAQQAQQARR